MYNESYTLQRNSDNLVSAQVVKIKWSIAGNVGTYRIFNVQ